MRAPDDPHQQPRFPRHRLIGLIAGPVIAAAILLSPSPDGLSQQGWWTAAVGMWMVIWWMTEAIPLAATAILPVVLFPVLGVNDIQSISPSYAHPLIFLFLGGFLLARAMSVWQLDTRLALNVLNVAGSSPGRVIGATMAVTAFLSMWISNTASAMVMLPIGLSIVSTFQEHQVSNLERTAPALLLGIAFAATIGGMGTLIGTPPNALFAAFMAENYGIEISFLRWMLIGVPLILIMLPITWVVLTQIAFKVDKKQSRHAAELIRQKLGVLPVMSGAERLLTGLVLLVAACWICRPLLEDIAPWLQLTDAGIAMTGALLLFVLPVDIKRGHFLLSWKEAVGIRWDVLILFGGGLALASMIGESDLAQWMGAQLIALRVLPLFLLLLAVGALVVFVGELASNTAMAAVFLPIAGAAAIGMGEPSLLLTLPVALFATLGFMLPVATPPNAIVFGSGAVQMGHMLRAGFLLDIIGIFVIALTVLIAGHLVLA